MEEQALSSKHREAGTITISSGARLTIDNAADFVQRFRDVLTASQNVALEFDTTVEVDITTLQTLCSACKTAAVAGKSLTAHGSGPESLKQLIVAAGAVQAKPEPDPEGVPLAADHA